MGLKPLGGSSPIFFLPGIKGSALPLLVSPAPREKERDSLTVSLTLSSDSIFHFFPWLQRGVRVKVRLGCSLKTLLVEQLGLSSEYLRERVRIIFLDGKPVDDLEKARVKNGSILALSSAMPGLAGASLRTGSPFSAFRREMSHRENGPALPSQEGFIWVKLFNFLVPELGPILLKRGVFLSPEEFKEFMESLPRKFWAGIKQAIVNGQEMEVNRLLDLTPWRQDRWVFIPLHFESEESPPAERRKEKLEKTLTFGSSGRS